MTTYFYQATNQRGKLIEGDVEAEDYPTAIRRVRSFNYLPIKVTEGKPRRSLSFDLKLPGAGFKKKISQKELMTCTQQLATLIDSGFTLDKGLTVLVQVTEKPFTREILSEVQKRVHEGSSFGDALAEHPNIFSKLYINMIRAGEAGGMLPSVLNRLAEFMENSEEMKANIRSAMIYPAILTLVGGSAVALLITVVIPKFSTLFDDMGQALPLPTKIMLGISSTLTNYWWAILIALTAFVISIH